MHFGFINIAATNNIFRNLKKVNVLYWHLLLYYAKNRYNVVYGTVNDKKS